MLFQIFGSVIGLSAINYGTKYYLRPKKNYISAPYNYLLSSAVLSGMAYYEPETFNTTIENIRKPEPTYRIFKNDETAHILNKVFPENYQEEIQFVSKDRSDCQVYMWKNEDTYYIVFRGTESTKDVMIDMDVRTTELEEDSGIQVHEGFYRQYNSVSQEIDNFIAQSDHSTIVTVGHSLGGSLATLATYYLSKKYADKKIICHTFGSPRVGNKNFVNALKELNSDMWRVYNFGDPVPMIPITCRFDHVCGNSICFEEDRCDDLERDYNWMIRIPTEFCCLTMFNMIDKHSISLYVSNLENTISTSSS